MHSKAEDTLRAALIDMLGLNPLQAGELAPRLAGGHIVRVSRRSGKFVLSADGDALRIKRA